jgi:hypothetical protein
MTIVSSFMSLFCATYATSNKKAGGAKASDRCGASPLVKCEARHKNRLDSASKYLYEKFIHLRIAIAQSARTQWTPMQALEVMTCTELYCN